MSDNAIFGLTGVVIVALVCLMVHAAHVEQRQWNAFAAEHACKVVGRVTGDVLVSPVISQNGGIAVTTTPDKVGFLCNDGVTYWRDN